MSKYYVLGGLSCLSGLVLMLYQAVSSLMTVEEIVWKHFTIMDLLEPEQIEWINGISINFISSIMKYVVSAPLSYLLLGVGVLLFIIGGIVDK
jgi:hypothetical protein